MVVPQLGSINWALSFGVRQTREAKLAIHSDFILRSTLAVLIIFNGLAFILSQQSYL